MSNDLLELPFAIQVALGSGYAAYLLAFAGLRQHHTATDVVFRTVAFGIIASTVFQLLSEHPITGAFLAFTAAIISGGLWRSVGKKIVKFLLRITRVSWTDDIPNAWLTITAERTDLCPSQIVVEMKDGRLLMCDDTRDFEEAPFKTCVFGLDGGVALYVTSEMRPNGEWLVQHDVNHDSEGAKITYVPPNEVKRVEIRHWRKPNATASTVVEQA